MAERRRRLRAAGGGRDAPHSCVGKGDRRGRRRVRSADATGARSGNARQARRSRPRRRRRALSRPESSARSSPNSSNARCAIRSQARRKAWGGSSHAVNASRRVPWPSILPRTSCSKYSRRPIRPARRRRRNDSTRSPARGRRKRGTSPRRSRRRRGPRHPLRRQSQERRTPDRDLPTRRSARATRRPRRKSTSRPWCSTGSSTRCCRRTIGCLWPRLGGRYVEIHARRSGVAANRQVRRAGNRQTTVRGASARRRANRWRRRAALDAADAHDVAQMSANALSMPSGVATSDGAFLFSDRKRS